MDVFRGKGDAAMRGLGANLVVLLFTMQVAALCAQTSQKPLPQFTLTLMRGPHGPQIVKEVQVLVVRLTNISNEPISESVCLTFDGLYKISALYNGTPVGDDKERKCSGETFMEKVDPGRSLDDQILYDTGKPGTYQFTVERRAYPLDPTNTLAVKSNTLAVEVPEYGNAATESDFNLSISLGRPRGEFAPTVVELVVKMTNTSKDEIILESPCSAFEALFKIDVVLDGVLLDESKGARKHREEIENAEAKGGFCEGSNPGRRAAPGDSLDYHLYYDAKKSGTYEFTVERKTFPHNLANSVIVQSNTIAIVMPGRE